MPVTGTNATRPKPERDVERIRYPARFFTDPSDPGCIGVEFPGLGGAGMATHGNDLEHARAMAREVVTGYLKTCFKFGDPIEEPPHELPRGRGWEWVYPEPTAEVAALIRRLRESHGLSQQEAAERLGIRYTTYKRWEHPGQCNATIRTLGRIARAFGRQVEVVFR